MLQFIFHNMIIIYFLLELINRNSMMEMMTTRRMRLNQLNNFWERRNKMAETRKEKRNDWRKAVLTARTAKSFFIILKRIKKPTRAVVPERAKNSAK
ncbi:MAG: hypothetical protein AUK17_02400 [Parcubacteria group bacterium CG2_30_44_18]|nr:MAG: hypothetical protein AUK17_02400 [Parcubacteria group bacterium CG2_30_44_18]